jgi:hypothetical protein
MMPRDPCRVTGSGGHARFERTEKPSCLALDPVPLPPGGAVAGMRIDDENRSVEIQNLHLSGMVCR